MVLPSDVTKVFVSSKYKLACDENGWYATGRSKFSDIWQELLPHIVHPVQIFASHTNRMACPFKCQCAFQKKRKYGDSNQLSNICHEQRPSVSIIIIKLMLLRLLGNHPTQILGLPTAHMTLLNKFTIRMMLSRQDLSTSKLLENAVSLE